MSPLTAQLDYFGIWHISLFVVTLLSAWWLLRKQEDLWVYAVGWSLYIVEFPALHFGQWNTAYQATAGQTLTEMLLIPGLAVSVKYPEKLINWYVLPVLYSIICVWFGLDGLMIAPSFNTGLIALYLPFAPTWVMALGIITIIAHHGATAQMMIAAYALVIVVKRKEWRLLVALPVAVAAAFYHTHGSMFDAGERIAKQTIYMNYWASSLQQIIIGVGPGTFMWSSLMIDQFKDPLFLAMHNDWLQILFELGVIGFLLALDLFRRALIYAWKDEKLLCGVVGAGVFGLSYHPLRFAPTALLIALIFSRTMRLASDSRN